MSTQTTSNVMDHETIIKHCIDTVVTRFQETLVTTINSLDRNVDIVNLKSKISKVVDKLLKKLRGNTWKFI